MNIKLNYREIGDRLLGLRNRKNLGQGDLSKALNIRQPSMSSYEQGKSKIPLEVLLKYAVYFQETLDFLVMGYKSAYVDSLNPAKYYKLYLQSSN